MNSHRARSDEEFVEFARASSTRLQHAAYLLTGDPHQAEDAAQAALVRTYAAWSRVNGDDAYAYTRRVLVNLITDRWRRPLKEYATEVLPDRAVGRDLAEDVARRRQLITALAALSVKERAVVVMRHYFDLSEADTARQLRLSLSAVKSLNSRGLAKLRAGLDLPAPAVESGTAHHPPQTGQTGRTGRSGS